MTAGRKTRKTILKMVEKIIKEYQPKKIILFGSYAYGEPTEDSDVDLLIVSKRSIKPDEIYRRRHGFLKDFSIPVQLVCVSDKEFAETKDVIGGITYPASKYGEILYEKS